MLDSIDQIIQPNEQQIQQQPNEQQIQSNDQRIQPIDYNTQQQIQPKEQIQPKDQDSNHDEFIHFRPVDQTDEIIILKSTPVIAPTNPPTDLSTDSSLQLRIELEEYINQFSHSLENFIL